MDKSNSRDLEYNSLEKTLKPITTNQLPGYIIKKGNNKREKNNNVKVTKNK